MINFLGSAIYLNYKYRSLVLSLCRHTENPKGLLEKRVSELGLYYFSVVFTI